MNKKIEVIKKTNNIQENRNNKSKINVFIIGLRGYTQNYGGWEAFAHGLLDNWIDEDVHFFAFEKVDEFFKEEIVEVNRVTCIRICEKEKGSSAMMKYDKNCTEFACEYIKKNNISNPILFHLGVRIGPYLWLKRNKIKKMGIKMMENPAGAEWRRTKWNKAVQIYLWISAMLMAKASDCLTCDNEGIKELYDRMLIGRKPQLEFVAYGVNEANAVPEEMPEKVKKYFDKWNIQKDEYYLVLGRFVPENNYEMMLKGFMKSNTKRKLLVICNYKTELQKYYHYIKKNTKFYTDDRIVMAGTLYEPEILNYVRQHARGYVHGHSVGGTNPGLLEAMAETDVNILYDVNFNKYVGDNAALYFKTEIELAKIIEQVDIMKDEERLKRGRLARKRMRDHYSWVHIVEEYNKIIHKLVES